MDKCSTCRKFSSKLFLKGPRCISQKCAITKRNYKPGQHGPKQTNQRKSEYGLQLLEKQKAKAEYIMRERQFRNLFHKASISKKTTGEELLKLLETRFDNIVYRLGWAKSRAQARQLISHRSFLLNNKIVNIGSINLKPEDLIKPRKKIELNKTSLPKWLSYDVKNNQGKLTRLPLREEIESDLDEQLIIEFYSR